MRTLDRGRAREILSSFEGRRVLVVGDVMLDRFIWGEVNRISPEAPVPVVRVERETVHLGGAGNVAANLARLGARPVLVGIVGSDPAGDQLASTLSAEGIEASLVAEPHRATTVKTRIIARGQQVVRVDRETEGSVGGHGATELEARILKVLGHVEALVISDYDKGVISEGLIGTVLSAANARALPVVVDPKPAHFPYYKSVTLITPNQSEAARAAGMEIRSDEDCLTAAQILLARHDTHAILVTRGERGMLLLERGGSGTFISSVAREVYDVTGAGDSVVAVLTLAVGGGCSLEEAAILANHAGGVVVGKVGTATVSPSEILDHLSLTN